jgi:hypothetical protein
MNWYCEGEGGTGLAFNKEYNNAQTHCNCYSFDVFDIKIILKAYRLRSGNFLVYLSQLAQIILLFI